MMKNHQALGGGLAREQCGTQGQHFEHLNFDLRYVPCLRLSKAYFWQSYDDFSEHGP